MKKTTCSKPQQAVAVFFFLYYLFWQAVVVMATDSYCLLSVDVGRCQQHHAEDKIEEISS